MKLTNKVSVMCVGVLMLAAVIFSAGTASAIVMTVDSGPWYLSDPTWFNNAKADTVNGTFINLRTGTYPGTNYVDPVDFLNERTERN